MLAKQYADAVSDRLSPDLFRPVPSRALWLPVDGFMVVACTMAIVNADLGVFATFGLATVIGLAFCRMGLLGH